MIGLEFDVASRSPTMRANRPSRNRLGLHGTGRMAHLRRPHQRLSPRRKTFASDARICPLGFDIWPETTGRRIPAAPREVTGDRESASDGLTDGERSGVVGRTFGSPPGGGSLLMRRPWAFGSFNWAQGRRTASRCGRLRSMGWASRGGDGGGSVLAGVPKPCMRLLVWRSSRSTRQPRSAANTCWWIDRQARL